MKGNPASAKPANHSPAKARFAAAVAAHPDLVQEIAVKDLRRSPFNREIDQTTPGFLKLVESIKKNGVLMAGMARPTAEGLEIVFGERRWLASKAAKRPAMPFKVREMTDIEALELQAIENMAREDLNPIDEAHKYKQLLDHYQTTGAKREEAFAKIKEMTGAERSTVYARTALLNLPAAVVPLILKGTLPASHAELLTKLKDPATIKELAGDIVNFKRHGEDAGLMPFRDAKRLVEEEVTKEKNLAKFNSLKTEFEAKGLRVLTIADRKKIGLDISIGHNGYVGIYGKAGNDYVGGKSTHQGDASFRDYQDLWKMAPPGILVCDEDFDSAIIYLKADADEAAKAKLKPKTAVRGKSSEADIRREVNHRRGIYSQAIGRIVETANTVGYESETFWRFVIKKQIHQAGSDARRVVAKRRDMPKGGDPEEFLAASVETLKLQELRGLMLELTLAASSWPSTWVNGFTDTFKEACGLWDVDLKQLGYVEPPKQKDDAADEEEEDDDAQI